MIFLIICLASGLASSEKLDRSYLPPPGSKFSGGSPGDIEVPLEYPNKPTGPLGNGPPEIELGINRRPAPPTGLSDSQKPGFNYFQKSYPTTTTSYAITQTTTFAPDDDYTEIDQPSGFLNGSTVQSGFPGQNKPDRPSQGPYNQYQPGQSQSTVAPFGTTPRPRFPGVFNGPEYLPPASNKQSPSQGISNQAGTRYPSRLPQGPNYQDGQPVSVNQPGYVPQENQYVGNQNTPSSAATQYQGFVPTGPNNQQSQNQFSGSQFPPSTSASQYEDGQRLIIPGPNQQIQFTENQFPSSTAAPQYQDGKRLITPGPSQKIQFTGSRIPSSTAAPQYQDGQRLITPGLSEQIKFTGSQFPSSTAAPQYQDGQRLITPGPSQQIQFTGSRIPSSTAAPQYQDGQRLITPEPSEQIKFTGSQFPSSTAAPQNQDGKWLIIPGPSQRNQFSGNQDQELPSSTVAPQFGQMFTTPGLNQQVPGARLPNQQNKFTGYQYPGNRNFPSSTAAPTPGSINESQFPGNQNFQYTAAPNYQDGQRFTMPAQIQGALMPGQTGFESSVTNQNQLAGQRFPTSTSAPQFQNGVRLTTPSYIQEGQGSPALTQENKNQYPGYLNYSSSTTAPQNQNAQQFTTPGSIGIKNYPSTAAPNYQDGPRFTTPGQYQGQLFGSRIPGQQSQSQSSVNQNYPSSTSALQYQDGQRFSTPGAQDRFDSPLPNQQSQYPGKQNFPTSTSAPQYQDVQRFSTPGSGQTFESPQQNQYGNQHLPTSTATPQYQGQRITTPGQLFNQPTYPGSTASPQYQPTLAPTPNTNQQGVLPSQKDKFGRPVYNQQFPSSKDAPQGFIPGSQYENDNILTPGTAAAFPDSQPGAPGGSTYGSTPQPISQTGGSSVSGTGAGFPSTTIGNMAIRDFESTVFGTVGGIRPERPQAEGDRNAEILRYESELTPEGYFYSYDTSNGIHADETGTVGNGTRAQGSFSYIGDDGKVYSVVYSADENGFQPQGDHLPTPPPIPEAIQRVIDQANKDLESGIDDDGSYNEEKYGYMKYEGPLTRIRMQNRTASVINGADIPDQTKIRVGGQTKKTSKNRGGKPVLNRENGKIIDSEIEEFEVNGPKTEEIDVNEPNRRVDDNLHNNSEKNRRISSKRPKPINNLRVEDNRSDRLKGKSMPAVSTINANTSPLQKNKSYERNSSNRQPNLSEEDEEPSDDNTEESGDDDLQESQGLDYDSDLVNYRDDPNNRTDFHGLNKYLPESKKKSRKNQSGKKRPIVRVDAKKTSPGFNEVIIPEHRYSQDSEDNRADLVDKARTRIPSRKTTIGQRVKDKSTKTGLALFDSDDEVNLYDDDKIDADEEHGSGDASKSVSDDRVNKPGTSQLRMKISGKPKRPNVNEGTKMSDDKEAKSSSYEDNGYEYTPPKSKFGSEEAIKFPSKVYQKGTPTTLRPIYDAKKPGRGRPMTGQMQYPGYNQDGDSHNNSEDNAEGTFSTTKKPVSYGTSRPFGSNGYNQNNPEVNQDVGFPTTTRPVSYGTSRPFGRPKITSVGYNQNIPQLNEDVEYSTTRRPISYGTTRPSGRPQTTGAPQYEEEAVPGQAYNPTSQSQRPADKLYYNTNAPNRGTDGNVFSSTTPLPPSGRDSNQNPGYQNRPTSDYESTARGEEYDASKPIGQVPSTTYRPNYSFGDKISSPVAVNDFGRPIQSNNSPAFDKTIRPTYSVRPSESANGQFRPTGESFGVTSTQGSPGYQSTSAPIGEDFSGPKQPQRFDPKTGYHYK